MTQINLRMYANPGHAEVYLRFDLANGNTRRVTAIVNTAADATLLPQRLLREIEIHDPRKVWVERTGLAEFGYEAVEADVYVQVEDEAGNRTEPFEIVLRFAGTLDFVAGYGGLLNRTILYLDMPNLNGYLEFPD